MACARGAFGVCVSCFVCFLFGASSLLFFVVIAPDYFTRFPMSPLCGPLSDSSRVHAFFAYFSTRHTKKLADIFDTETKTEAHGIFRLLLLVLLITLLL